MFVIRVSNVDSSCHSNEQDALFQKNILLSLGVNEQDIIIVETDNFSPVNPVH